MKYQYKVFILFILLSSFKGPQGPQGPVGFPGPKGPNVSRLSTFHNKPMLTLFHISFSNINTHLWPDVFIFMNCVYLFIPRARQEKMGCLVIPDREEKRWVGSLVRECFVLCHMTLNITHQRPLTHHSGSQIGYRQNTNCVVSAKKANGRNTKREYKNCDAAVTCQRALTSILMII